MTSDRRRPNQSTLRTEINAMKPESCYLGRDGRLLPSVPRPFAAPDWGKVPISDHRGLPSRASVRSSG